MRLPISLIAILLVGAHYFSPPAIALVQTLPAPTPLLSPSICGKGTFVFLMGGKPAGRETFEITCKPEGGYSASGRTEFNLTGAVSDLSTTLELDKSGQPLSSTSKGTVGGQPLDQSITIEGDKARLNLGSGTREIPYSRGTPLVGGNIFFMLQFVAACYDGARGGKQQFTAFPKVDVRIERTGHDQVTPTGASPLSFDRYSLVAGLAATNLWFDQKGRLSMVSVPAQQFLVVREEYAAVADALNKLAAAKTGTEAEPDYSAPPGAPYTSEEVTVQAKGFSLAGTLLVPKSAKRPVPAVITITGSGQQTRDERIPIAGLEKYRPFGQIAEALAAEGIAVLRVDDRGVGKSGGRETLGPSTSADYADDVRAQIDFLRARPEIDPSRIALMGHSEGGIIAPMVAASDPRVAAIVLLAGTAKNGIEVLTFQFSDALKGDPTISAEDRERRVAARRKMLTTIAEGGDTSKIPPDFKSGWMKFFIAYDPLVTIKKVRQPILIVQGELDHQVTPEQAPMIEKAATAAGNKDVTLRMYPNLNHLFLPAKTGEPAEYTSLSTSQLGQDLIRGLVDWLKQKLNART
jgi:dipeptidyl aminopeptidase/acylaminoacyl peptidase